MTRQYNTRSNSRNLFQDLPSGNSGTTGNPQMTPSRHPEQSNNNDTFSPIHVSNNNPEMDTNAINYDVINRMIETSNPNNLFSQPNQNVQNYMNPSIPNMTNNNHQPQIDTVSSPAQHQHFGGDVPRHNNNLPLSINHISSQSNRVIPPPNGPTSSHSNMYQRQTPNNPRQVNNNLPENLNPPLSNLFLNSNSPNPNMPLDKITSIIQNWNLKFDGSSNGLNVDEFLYRLGSLTSDYFNGDYSVICRNLNSLLTGKARDWYWRYHKQVQYIEWGAFSDALRNQYKEFKSSFDIREDIRARKQKPNETFDVFFEVVSAMMDKLPRAMIEPELIEIIARNLRPDIRQELLYVPIHSISHLRRLVQMRENFLSDEYVRRNLLNKNLNPFQMPRRNVAEIATDDRNNTVSQEEAR